MVFAFYSKNMLQKIRIRTSLITVKRLSITLVISIICFVEIDIISKVFSVGPHDYF